MRAAIMRNRRLVVDEIAQPEPRSGEVLVKTLACGICGSDLHTLAHAERLVESSRRSDGPFSMDLSRDVVMGHDPECTAWIQAYRAPSAEGKGGRRRRATRRRRAAND